MNDLRSKKLCFSDVVDRLLSIMFWFRSQIITIDILIITTDNTIDNSVACLEPVFV